jgi:hypothetical protein
MIVKKNNKTDAGTGGFLPPLPGANPLTISPKHDPAMTKDAFLPRHDLRIL